MVGKRRGAAKGNDYTHDPNRFIEFTKEGEPVGANRPDYTSWFGTEIRVQIPYYLDWNTKEVPHDDNTKVTPQMLNRLWDVTKSYWNIPNDNYKGIHMRKVNKIWRKFKSELTTQFAAKDVDPFEKYSYLNKEEWPRFVESRTTEEFKVFIEHVCIRCFQ